MDKFKDKKVVLSLASLIVLLLSQMGFGYIFPPNIMKIIETLCTILVIMGIMHESGKDVS